MSHDASNPAQPTVLVLSPLVRRVLAPNPSPMTLEGTNTWILGDPAGLPVVVDPGPEDAPHRDRVLGECRQRIGLVLVTHRHADHVAGAAALAGAAGCAVRAADPSHSIDAPPLSDGDRLRVGDHQLEVHATPGHTSDSVSFLFRSIERGDPRPALLTGDTVLGRGTTVITDPDGDIAAYLDSLDRLQRLVAEHQVDQILPGHGPVVERPGEVLAFYRRHRVERLDQVTAALAAGAVTAADVVQIVYADVDRSVWPAAEQSVRAQLRYLRSRQPSD